MFTRFLKAFAVLVILTGSQMASAICYRNLNEVPPGGPGLFSVYGMFCTQNVRPEQQGGVAIPQQVIIRDVSQVGGNPIYVNGGGMPTGGFSSCSTIGALAGGTLGSLTNHHRGQAVILGAIIGGVAGNWACSPSVAQQRVATQQQVVATQVVTTPAVSGIATAGQKSCTRFWSDGRKEKKMVSSEAECDAFIASSKSQAPQSEVVATNTATPAASQGSRNKASVCRRNWSDGRVETKEGLTEAQCDEYQAGKIN